MQYAPFVKEAKNGQTKVNQLLDVTHTTLSGIAAISQAIGVLSIEYSLFDSSRTGTIYGHPHSRRRKPVTFIWLFGFYNAWLLTHTESQAFAHYECGLTHRLSLQNWLREWDSNPRNMLMRHVSEPHDYPAIKN